MNIRRKAGRMLKEYADASRWVASVRRVCEFYDIPQARLAQQAGVSEADMSRWMNQRTVPSIMSMLKVDAAMFDLVADAKREMEEV